MGSVKSAISANCFPKVSKQEADEHKTEWNLGKMCRVLAIWGQR